MTVNAMTGNKVPPLSVEETVPYDRWLSWLKNLALDCINNFHLPKKSGYKHDAVAMWEVIILSALLALSFNEAADQLNEVLWKEWSHHNRRKKGPKQFNGSIVRRERLCPNGDQVRKYRNRLPNYILKHLNRLIFDQQLQYAEQHGLISKNLTILVDDTQQWYYGKDRYPQNPFITGGHNGPGTNKKRKYLGMMLKSGTTYLYCGVELLKKGDSEIPFIMATLDHLIQRGYFIDKILADRWFPTYEMFSELNARGIHYIGPYKKMTPIKTLILKYLADGKQYIIPYVIKGAPAKFYHLPQQKVWLILTNRQGRRLRDIRNDYLKGLLTSQEAMKEIFVIVTNIPPPKGRKAQQGWAVKICHAYDSRWNIETGFRDANRIGSLSNARQDVRKFFMFSLRFWIFNAWHLERAKRHRLKHIPKSWKNGPTLRTFGRKIAQLEGCI